MEKIGIDTALAHKIKSIVVKAYSDGLSPKEAASLARDCLERTERHAQEPF